MLLLTVIVSCATFTISVALKCYAGGPSPNNGSVAVPLQECHPTAYSCMKTVDLATNMASYYCSSSNCTTRTGALSDTAICYNTTNELQMNCCCYTDGCNSSTAARSYDPNFSAVLLITLFFIFLSHAGTGTNRYVM